MAKRTILMAVPRHPEVPASAANEIVLAEATGLCPAYGGAVLLLSTRGIAYLPVPYDAQTWLGVGIGMLTAGLVQGMGESVVKILIDQAGSDAAQAVVEHGVVPGRVAASLRSSYSFTAGYPEIVSVGHVFGWSSVKLIIESPKRDRSLHTKCSWKRARKWWRRLRTTSPSDVSWLKAHGLGKPRWLRWKGKQASRRRRLECWLPYRRGTI